MKAALFLDRDGVVNVDKNHLYLIDEIEFIEGIFELIARAKAFELMVVIVTNQSGIARGLYTQKEFDLLMKWMARVIEEKGGSIDAVYFCPTHPDFPNQALDPVYQGWRKPEPGMLLAAAKDLNIDMSQSLMIGDRLTDVEAGIRAGVRRSLLVSSTHDHQAVVDGFDVVHNLNEALSWMEHLLGP